MDKLSGAQILAVLKMRAESSAFKGWNSTCNPLNHGLFMAHVWLHTQWTQWFWNGYIDGALTMYNILNQEKVNSPEYQCLQHHFCLINERE